MIKNNKKQVYGALVIVLILFILSFIIFSFLNDKNKLSNVDKDSLVVNFEKDNQITLKNILPVSDALGKEFDGHGSDDGIQGFLEFSVKNISNKKVSYQIFLTKNKSKSKEIAGDFIKLYFSDEKDNPLKGFDSNKIPTYNSLLFLENKPDCKLLFNDDIASGDEKKYKLRAWLSDLYAISASEESFEFRVEVKEY